MNHSDETISAISSNGRRAGLAGRILRLIIKELKEILRDRRTILTLVLMPLILYPLLSIAFQQFLVAGHAGATTKASQYKIGFPSAAQGEIFKLLTKDNRPGPEHLVGQTLAAEALAPTAGPMAFAGPPLIACQVANLAPPPFLLFYPDKGKKLDFPRSGILDLELRLQTVSFAGGHGVRRWRKPEMAAVLRQIRLKEAPAKTVLQWQIRYINNSPRSLRAAQLVEQKFARAQTELLLNGIDPAHWPDKSVISHSHSQAISIKATEIPFAALVPLILILMTITGAVYPAIDLTAGERERGTLEVLVAAPVPRLGLLFAKYVSVLTVAVLTALINLTMMTLMIWRFDLSELVFGESGLSLLRMVEVFGLLLLFAVFFSAVLLSLTSFARSFKEAQAYLIPLMLVSLAPGLAGMLPGLALSPALCMVPLLNIVLLGRDILNSAASLLHVVLVVSSTLIYAAAAIGMAARIFGAENVLYNEQASWTDIFRRPKQPQTSASLTSVLICLCIIIFLAFIAQGVKVQIFGGRAPNQEELVAVLLAGTLFNVLLFVLIPFLSALVRRVQVSTGFGFESCGVLSILGALILGLTVWPLVLEFSAVLKSWGWSTIGTQQGKQLVDAMRNLHLTLPLWLLLIAHVVPAIVEEIFFRGFLFRALTKIANAPTTIVAAALLFSVSHFVVTGDFGLERLPPSFLMGLLLGWVCWKSGSVLPAILLHACHNGMLIAAGHLLAKTGAASSSSSLTTIPLIWLGVGLAGLLLGSLLLFFSKRNGNNEIRNVEQKHHFT